MGAFDLYSAKGTANVWSEPANMGYPVNSSRDDIYFYAPEKTRLLENAIVGSDRGAGCCIETYRVNKAPKQNKLSGLVLDCKNHKPVADASIVFTTPAGETRTTTTDINGNYTFDTCRARSSTTILLQLANRLTAIQYQTSQITKTDETNLLIDQLFNTDLCVEKEIRTAPRERGHCLFRFRQT